MCTITAITPDRLRDRRACGAGPWKGPNLTRAAMGLALGPFPLDVQAKAQAGQAVLFVTNGFKCASSMPCLSSQTPHVAPQLRH